MDRFLTTGSIFFVVAALYFSYKIIKEGWDLYQSWREDKHLSECSECRDELEGVINRLMGEDQDER